MKRSWTQSEIEKYDAMMRERNPGYDTFLPDSAAAYLGNSYRTFRNRQSNDPRLGFIKCLPDGGIVTCAESCRALAKRQRDTRQISSPRYPFVSGFSLTHSGTSVSSGAGMIANHYTPTQTIPSSGSIVR